MTDHAAEAHYLPPIKGKAYCGYGCGSRDSHGAGITRHGIAITRRYTAMSDAAPVRVECDADIHLNPGEVYGTHN